MVGGRGRRRVVEAEHEQAGAPLDGATGDDRLAHEVEERLGGERAAPVVGEQQQAAGTFRRHHQKLGRDAAREAAGGAGAMRFALAGLHHAQEALGVDDLAGHLDATQTLSC